MKKMISLVFIFLVIISINAYEFYGIVCKVSDGDTITVISENDKKIKIRFADIDAPESSQKYGFESKNYLSRRILSKKVKIEVNTIDRYGRAVSTVYLGEENINEQMVKEGWAWWYRNFSKKPIYGKYEAEAKLNKKGMWNSNDNIAPWEYRKFSKKTPKYNIRKYKVKKIKSWLKI